MKSNEPVITKLSARDKGGLYHHEISNFTRRLSALPFSGQREKARTAGCVVDPHATCQLRLTGYERRR